MQEQSLSVVVGTFRIRLKKVKKSENVEPVLITMLNKELIRKYVHNKLTNKFKNKNKTEQVETELQEI